MSLAYRSGEEGNFLVQMISTCPPSRRGRRVGGLHPVGTVHSSSIYFCWRLMGSTPALPSASVGKQYIPATHREEDKERGWDVSVMAAFQQIYHWCCGSGMIQTGSRPDPAAPSFKVIPDPVPSSKPGQVNDELNLHNRLQWSRKLEQSEEVSCFEVLDVLFCELKASHVVWTSCIEA